MSDQYVWYSQAIVDSWDAKAFCHDKVGARHESDESSPTFRNNQGDVLDRDQFPDKIWSTSTKGKAFAKTPSIFLAFGYWVVSEKCAGIIQKYALGGAQFFPVEVFESDQKTPISEERLFCINFGNVRNLLIPDSSKNIKTGAQGRWRAKAGVEDFDLCLSAEAMHGPEIWIDQSMWSGLFVRKAIGDELRKAKATAGWKFIKASVASKS